MSDIFISYKREDQSTARKLADALESEGWSVWWDPKLRAGEHFDDMIEKALHEAKCVIVLWSEQSVQSRYVRDEATYGLEKNKLVPVAIENATLPFRFRGVQTSSLLHWDGSRDSPQFRRLVEDISAILRPTPVSPAKDEEHRNPDEKDEQERRRTLARRYPWRMYGTVAAAVAVVLIIFSFVFWPKPQGAAEKIIVLVGDFDGPDPQNYRVTEAVINHLNQVTKKYDDIEIQGLEKAITEKEGSKVAQTEGKKRKAAIVLWGWYGIPGDVVTLSVHFEVLSPPKGLPQLGQSAGGAIQQASIAELKGAILQARLSTEMTYLSLFVLGMSRRAAGDWDGAIARFSDALGQTTQPSSSLNRSLVFFYRGVTYLLKGDSDHALADLNQAIKLQPKLAEAYVNRSVIYSAKGDYSHSLADLNQAIQLKPDLTVAYNNRGLLYLQAKDYDQAIDNFSQALKLFVSTDSKISPSIGSQLGTIKFDRDVPVLNFFFTELSDYMIYINRGDAYLSKGDHDRALKDFNHAIKLQSNGVLAYFNRAAAYFTKQDYDRALADLNQTIKLQPDFALAYLKRGSVYYFKGDFDRALADLNQAIKLQPNSAFFYSNRGEVYAKRDDHDRAIADFSQVIKLQPDWIAAYLSRGESYLKTGDNDRAFADFDQALKLTPDNAGAYNNRGWTYAQKGDYDRALDDLNQAFKLKPGVAAFYDTRGFAYAGKGDYDRAMADYNQALKLKPDADYAYYHRGLVYRALGDHQKAIADFKRTFELTKNSKRRQDAEKQLQELGGIGFIERYLLSPVGLVAFVGVFLTAIVVWRVAPKPKWLR